MHQDAARFLSRPVAAQPGSPLRVAVYSHIAEAIRNGLLKPGSMIPTETELGADMKVSRTVVREALMLLEEDGLVRARRGAASDASSRRRSPASASNASARSRRSSPAPAGPSR
ncbi:winged helix-turn-helix domain-containing protein [Arthrobacter sp. NQ4]|uniref:winged helix-turn-helix domain-containing protein n=1 Tax=Arthrobacter sp. NQ4 TaxID=3027930 RepID=UPI0023B04AEB|nr:winged helix-turn-helix domain-containing protein [Arthrobacter sp. NQ4]MDE8588335.1 winged helix-turn-helix domain-containing protein [Arthrobacter sp. NQ4]